MFALFWNQIKSKCNNKFPSLGTTISWKMRMEMKVEQ